ncbi:GAF domain-containing protein [Carboxylicivirga sediminis]|uniref:histidine kinase n=1 Tax=Carboxylicivirga sediminis TaxID=2006564 RepID=A0A941F5Y3_9BACT|nr:two-component regulator propeller domain-containing protein [Carboxylicivirga sediminis]MBR8536554.1 GAF domain-containing protein [Carboxylicivirga sediminis]
MKQALLIASLAFWLVTQLSVAQHFHFKQYSLEEGLPQSEVASMAEDQFGYLWVGTNGGGLCRFNGKNFEVFTKKDGLFDNIILGLLHDRNYDLWVATPKGIQRYNGINYESVIEADTTLFTDNAQFCETQDGNIWCLVHMISGEHRLYSIRNNQVTNISETYKDQLIDSGTIFKIMADDNNNLLMATSRQLLVFDNDSIRNFDDGLVAKDQKVIRYPLFRDRSKHLWLNLFGPDDTQQLIIHIDGKGDKTIPVPKEAQDFKIFKGFQDREGTYWFLMDNGGVMQFSKKSGWRIFNKQNGLPINMVFNIHQDAEGNIWMGTLGAGLVRYSGDLFVSLNRSNGLTDDIIRAIFQDSKGTYYFADGEGGFSTLTNKELTTYKKQDLPDLVAIKEFYELPSGNILMATIAGLWEFDGKSTRSVNEKYGWSRRLPLSDIVVQNDTFFFSTYNHGLIKSHKGKASFYNTYNAHMQDNTIFHMLSDSQQRLWLSTSRGIILYQQGEFTQFTEGQEIPSSYILQAAEDKVGNIWFATFTNGLIRYDGKNWMTFDTDKGLSGDNIYSVIADKEGNIFAGAQNGIDKLSISSSGEVLSVIQYDKYDGFVGIENNGTANLLDNDGHLWFGTIKGAIMYNPMEKRTNFLAPNIYIRDIELSYKQPDWLAETYKTAYDSIIPWFGIPNRLALSSSDNNISFEFDALCYSVPEKVKYRWRLEPIETEWIEGYTNTVAYPSLPSGEYTFRVIAANNSNIWNEEGAIYNFSIHPEWYRTASFRALIIMLILGLIGALIISWQQRTKTLRFELETLISAKTKEINEQKKEISKQNEQLKNQNIKIEKQANSIANALNDLEKLTEIGKILTANLSTDNIFALVYKAASEVMDTYLFGVGLFNQESNSLDFNNVILKGERMPFLTFPLDDVERLSIHCLVNDKEIFINDFENEYKDYVQEIRPVPGDINSQSIIYIPLKVSGAPFGVLTVQSADKKAYGAYHLSFMRNISMYTSIALENAKAFSQLEQQRQSLEQVNKSAFEQNQLILSQQADMDRLIQENNHLISLFTKEIERPITSSVSLISSIKNEAEIDENEKDEALQYVFDALWQIKEMVNQVTEIKRLENSEFAINKSKFSIVALMREVAAQYAESLEEKEISINWLASEEIIDNDYTILEKVISNLLSNAIKFSPMESSIELSVKADDEQVIIGVSDQGPGIEEQDIPDLFTKYKKLASHHKSNAPSSGLGLYIVKRYIDSIGGSIECNSIVGEGTTFNVILPK